MHVHLKSVGLILASRYGTGVGPTLQDNSGVKRLHNGKLLSSSDRLHMFPESS